MKKNSIDNEYPKSDLTSIVEGIVAEKSPISRSVEILSMVKPSGAKRQGSDIELKTDFGSREQAIAHAVVDEIGRWLLTKPVNFNKLPITLKLTEVLERKFLSIERKSRGEIVTIAKSPETNVIEGEKPSGFLKRMVTPHRK